MEYDYIRLAFSVILLALGFGLVLSDSWKKGSSDKLRQTLKFGTIEVSTTSLGLTILVLATPILLLSRVSIEKAEFEARMELLSPLLSAYQSAINAYYDSQVQYVRDFLDEEYLPEYVETVTGELSEGGQEIDNVAVSRATVAAIRQKERELISTLEKDRTALLRSANEYVTRTLKGGGQATLQTLDEQIDAQRVITQERLQETVQKMSDLLLDVAKLGIL